MFERMGLKFAASLGTALALAGCATVPAAPAPQEVQILAINDFHGNLEPASGPVEYTDGSGAVQSIQLGGAARLGAELSRLRQGEANSVTVAAGDLLGASPLASAYYLDEPTVMALNRVGLEVASVGNHEFDKGVTELQRMQVGGCNGGKLVGLRKPCGLDNPFEGARFTYLAANVVDQAGKPLFPASTLRKFGKITVGFIGMTLKETKTLVSPGGTTGYDFLDEAETANAEAARLRAAGADAVVVLLHQGFDEAPPYSVSGCPSADGALAPVLARLDPAIRLVISGHTHYAYVCQVRASDGSERLITSAGKYGYFVTDIRLEIDPANDKVTGFAAANRPVTATAGEQADVAALVDRYVTAVAPEAAKVVGTISGTLTETGLPFPSLGYVVADAQYAATRAADKGGADFALVNKGGVRTEFAPAADGSVTYGQIFALQPFGNTLSVVEMTGAELLAAIEDVFGRADNDDARRRALLIPSANVGYSFDWSRPPGQRIVSFTLNGKPLDPGRTYHVALNNFLASGGDKYDLFARAKPVGDGGGDLDALEAWLAAGVEAPTEARVRDATPRP